MLIHDSEVGRVIHLCTCRYFANNICCVADDLAIPSPGVPQTNFLHPGCVLSMTCTYLDNVYRVFCVYVRGWCFQDMVAIFRCEPIHIFGGLTR